MTAIRDASTMYASMFSLVLFMMLFESRYSWRKTILLTLGLMGPLMILNCILLAVMGLEAMGTLVLLTCSLPSLVFFWFLSKYRDGRFFFTFTFADTIILELMDMTAILDFFLGNTYIFMAVSRLLLCPVLALFFWKCLRPRYLRLQKNVTNGWYTFVAISLIFYILMSISMSVPSHITQREDQLPGFILLLILLPFLYGHIFTTLHNQQLAHEAAEKENVLSLQVASLLSRVDEFSAANELLREERHNFRHKMRTVATLADSGEYEKLKALTAEYLKSEAEQSLENYCSHTLLDAVLSSYLREAKRKNIRVTVKAAFPDTLPGNESELATVFANALENAIYACEKLPPEDRFIEVKVIHLPCFMFQISNSFGGNILFNEKGIPVSHRKEHGFGTRSIVTFCEKYNAFYEFNTKDQEFILKVIFQ